MNIIRKAIEVSGRVQGVGYRYFVQDCAEDLGLTGWVRNSPCARSKLRSRAGRKTLKLFAVSFEKGLL